MSESTKSEKNRKNLPKRTFYGRFFTKSKIKKAIWLQQKQLERPKRVTETATRFGIELLTVVS